MESKIELSRMCSYYNRKRTDGYTFKPDGTAYYNGYQIMFKITQRDLDQFIEFDHNKDDYVCYLDDIDDLWFSAFAVVKNTSCGKWVVSVRNLENYYMHIEAGSSLDILRKAVGYRWISNRSHRAYCYDNINLAVKRLIQRIDTHEHLTYMYLTKVQAKKNCNLFKKMEATLFNKG